MFNGLNKLTANSRMDPETQSNRVLTEDDNTDSLDLSYSWRIYCFVGCLLLSIICSLLGSPFMFVGKFTEFAVMVSLGSCISIIGAFFLSNPLDQLKRMVDPKRLIATIIYFVMIALTLIAGLTLRNAPLAISCIVGQYIAMIWYSLSYIPYARNLISSCIWKFF